MEEFTSGGTFIQNIGTQGSGLGQIDDPVAVAFDSSGNLFVADYGQGIVEKFTLASAVPEPGSIALLIGMVTVGASVLRRNRRK